MLTKVQRNVFEPRPRTYMFGALNFDICDIKCSICHSSSHPKIVIWCFPLKIFLCTLANIHINNQCEQESMRHNMRHMSLRSKICQKYVKNTSKICQKYVNVLQSCQIMPAGVQQNVLYYCFIVQYFKSLARFGIEAGLQ
jgi:hypothetical protein